MNNNESMLSTLDHQTISLYSDLAYNNKSYEFECRVVKPSIKKDDFIRLRNNCREKTNYGNWKNIKEQSKSLDISVDDKYRITIEGLDNINKYKKTDSFSDLPNECWYVIEKSRVDVKNIENGKYDSDLDYMSALKDIGCRLNLKEEVEISKSSETFAKVLLSWAELNKTFRLKNRYSYLVDNMYSVDLTAVKSNYNKCKTFKESRLLSTKEKYEVELEYLPNMIGNINESDEKNLLNISSWVDILTTILCTCQNIYKVLPFSILDNVSSEYFHMLSGKKDKYTLSDRYQFKMAPKVVSLTMPRLRLLKDRTNEYFVTPKSDGLRMLGFIHSSGELFLLGSKSTYFEPSGYYFEESYAGCIFDGEFISKTKDDELIAHYLIFDCYFYKKEDIRSKNLEYRRNQVIDILNNKSHNDKLYNNVEFYVVLKKFIPLNEDNFHSSCIQCFNDIKGDIYENDGLIFTPIDKVGGNELYDEKSSGKSRFIQSGKEFQRMLKWKDVNFNSIDFQIKFIDTPSESAGLDNNDELPLQIGNSDKYIMVKYQLCSLHVLYNQSPEPYTFSNFQDYIQLPLAEKKKIKQTFGKPFVKEFIAAYPEDNLAKYVKLPIIDGRVRCFSNNMWSGVPISSGDIVEMIYNKDEQSYNRWFPIRIRQDKDTPNSYKVALDIWKSYYVPVSYDIMTGECPIPSIEDEIDTYYNSNSKGEKMTKEYRNFHRLVVKQNLLEESVLKTDGKKLLDLASGKGGDIPRYLSMNLNVVGVDNSVDNLHNAIDGAYPRLKDIIQERINHPGFKYDSEQIIFLAGDISKDLTEKNTYHSNYYDISQYKNTFKESYSFDTVSIFFAIHYFLNDSQTLHGLLDNIDRNTKIDGYFVGCCYDGKIINDEFVKNNGNDLVYRYSDPIDIKNKGTEVLRIKKNYDTEMFDENNYGNEIKVLVQSINKEHSEYLVNFDFLEKKMNKIGFDLVLSENFEYYTNISHSNFDKINLSDDDRKISFLNRTFIFQRKSIPKSKDDLIHTKWSKESTKLEKNLNEKKSK
tara:strand:- start:1272 stop:4364 length:3093 start_codon:yes stop_codon:yes gene_type:complete